MNTISLLLSMTAVLLLVTLLLSFGGVKVGGSDQDKHETLRREIADLKKEAQNIRLQAAIQRASAPIISAPASQYQTPITTVPNNLNPEPVSDQPIDDELAAQLKEVQQQLAEEREEKETLEAEKSKAERKADVAEREASMAWKERTKAQQRSERERRRVEIALLMGTVSSVNQEYGFLTFVPANGQQFQPGQKLGIRRNSGVLGQITVDNEEGGTYVANIMPNAYAGGIPPVEEGDELIVLPESYRAPGQESSPSGTSSSGSSSPIIDLLSE